MMYSTLRRCYYTNWPSNRSYSLLTPSVYKDSPKGGLDRQLQQWVDVWSTDVYGTCWVLSWVLRSQFLSDGAGKFNLWKGLWGFSPQKLILIISPLCWWLPVTVLSIPPSYSAKHYTAFSDCLKRREIFHWINLSYCKVVSLWKWNLGFSNISVKPHMAFTEAEFSPADYTEINFSICRGQHNL